MERKPATGGLTEKQKDDLVKTLNNFDKWLVKKKVVAKASQIKHVDLPAADEDWTMKVLEDGSVAFNTYLTKKCSLEYYQSIVIHEFFHLHVQKVPHKNDAVKIKDDFGAEMMKLIDIEADYFTALFYKEQLKYDVLKYLRLYYDGSKAFADEWIRVGKLERFIGSILGVIKLFLKTDDKPIGVNACDLYLPCVTPLHMDEKMHVLVIRKEHIYFDSLGVTNTDFVKMKECYAAAANSLTFKQYATKILDFCTKALEIKMPIKLRKDIQKITD